MYTFYFPVIDDNCTYFQICSRDDSKSSPKIFHDEYQKFAAKLFELLSREGRLELRELYNMIDKKKLIILVNLMQVLGPLEREKGDWRLIDRGDSTFYLDLNTFFDKINDSFCEEFFQTTFFKRRPCQKSSPATQG